MIMLLRQNWTRRPTDDYPYIVRNTLKYACTKNESDQHRRVSNYTGLLMMIDTMNERGFCRADSRWMKPAKCYFPLFDFIKPLPGRWMCLAYASMFSGKSINLLYIQIAKLLINSSYYCEFMNWKYLLFYFGSAPSLISCIGFEDMTLFLKSPCGHPSGNKQRST